MRFLRSEPMHAALWATLLAFTLPWIVTGTFAVGCAALIAIVGAILLLAAGRFRSWLAWWLAPALLLAVYLLLVGWVDLRVVFPAVVLLALMFACELSAVPAGRMRRAVALLVYVAVGVGVAVGSLPAPTLLVLLSAPLVARSAWRQEVPREEAMEAYGVTALLLWVGYLIQGIVR